MTQTSTGGPRVQSLARAFEVLERLADAGGTSSLSELATDTGLAPATIHRLIQSLVAGGYVRQEPSRRYALGPRLIRIGEIAGRSFGSWATPFLAELVEQSGETANMAMLEGDGAVYVAQAPSTHTVRMFTEVGRRVMLHCTGVGKALLAGLPEDEVRRIVGRVGLPPETERTIRSLDALLAALGRVNEQGYAVDDMEQEVGVRCVAVRLPGALARVAISVSGPSGRLTEARVGQLAPLMHDVAVRLAAAQQGAAGPESGAVTGPAEEGRR